MTEASPRQANDRNLVLDLIEVTDALAAVVERETALLGARRWIDMHELCTDKNRLAMRYDALVVALQGVPAAAVAADPRSARLRDSAIRLDAAVAVNARTLRLHIDANRRVVELVARAAREAATPRVSYARPRAAAQAPRTTPPVVVSRLL